jgi:outer membrane receptor protein involved in Fe transport
VFVQDLFLVTPRFQLTLSARLDHWRNYDAHNRNISAAGATAGQPMTTDRPSCNDVDPAVTLCLADKENNRRQILASAAVYHLSDSVSVWSALSWAIRATNPQ